MVSKELKKLSRRELVDIIYQMKKNEQQLQEEIASLQEALQDKRIHLSLAGSIADAATSIANVFSSAQEAANLYLHEIAGMKEETENECARMIGEARLKAAEIISDAEKQYADRVAQDRSEFERWQQFQADVHILEETMTTEPCEDLAYGEEI